MFSPVSELFQKLKEILNTFPILFLPDPQPEFVVEVVPRWSVNDNKHNLCAFQSCKLPGAHNVGDC